MIPHRRSIQGRRPLGRAFAALLIAAFALSSTAAAPAAPGGRQFVLDFTLKLQPASLSLCVGDRGTVRAQLWSAVWTVGNPPVLPQATAGVTIHAAQSTNTREIAESLSDNEVTSSFYTSHPPSAYFTIEAKKVGETVIAFDAPSPPNPREYIVAGLEILKVTVTPCYFAYMGAFGDTWPTRDVCDISKPFKLKGVQSFQMPAFPIPGFSFPAGTPACKGEATIKYYPNPQDPSKGRYNLDSKVTCGQGGWREEGGGAYKLIEYPDQKRADIILGGVTMQYVRGLPPRRAVNPQYATELRWRDSSMPACSQKAP